MLKNLKSISTATKYKDVAKIIKVFSMYRANLAVRLLNSRHQGKHNLKKLIDGLKLVQLIKVTGMNILMYWKNLNSLILPYNVIMNLNYNDLAFHTKHFLQANYNKNNQQKLLISAIRIIYTCKEVVTKFCFTQTFFFTSDSKN